MNYDIEEINNGIAKVRFSDGSWAEVIMTSDMTEDELDQAVWEYRPKTGGTPTFAAEGQTRTASEPPAPAENPDWLQNRLDAYGNAESQLEYITENGLAAWQSHVAQIKADNPKPSDD